MNRRSFLKTAALAAVAVPVVGLPESVPALPAPAPILDKPVWTIEFSRWQHSSDRPSGFSTQNDYDLEQMLGILRDFNYEFIAVYLDGTFIGHA